MILNDQAKKDLQDVLRSAAVKRGYAMLRVISGMTRYRIIMLLERRAEGLAVSHLAEALSASPSQISHQIQILRKFELVSGTRSGRVVTYQLNRALFRRFIL